MIVVRNLSKSFGSRTLWSEVGFTAGDGEMLALVGPSGAGKSTLLNCFGLLETPDSGEIRVDGNDIIRFGRGRGRRFRRDTLGYRFQNYALIENATVTANLDAALANPGARLRRPRRDHEAALERVGLAGRGGERIYRLSGGEQQRVALARLLVKKPSLVLADEPTGALDDANSEMVIDLLREMGERGCTVLIATHRDQVQTRCDSVFKVGR